MTLIDHSTAKPERERFAEMSAAERIAIVGNFIAETSQFTAARKAVLRTYRGWRLSKDGTFMMLTGLSGAGKTTVADLVLEDLEEEWQGKVSDQDAGIVEPTCHIPATAGITKERVGGLIRPVIKVYVEPKARCRGLLRDILRALGIRAPMHATFGDLMEMVELHLHKQEVRMIFLDEVHHIVEGQSKTTAYEASEVVKMLLLQARVQVVGIGLTHAESIVDNNPELPRHLRGRYVMTALAGGIDDRRGDYLGFLGGLSATLPFEQKPDLTKPEMALRLWVASEGLVGKIMNLVQEAATLAIEDGLKTVGIKQFQDAFGQIENVGEEENPFFIEMSGVTAYAKIRSRIALRRSHGSVPQKPQKPGFDK